MSARHRHAARRARLYVAVARHWRQFRWALSALLRDYIESIYRWRRRRAQKINNYS